MHICHFDNDGLVALALSEPESRMEEQIMKKLKNGWVEGSVSDFLEVSDG